MVVFNNIIAGASGATSGAAAGFKIDRSLRFNSADSAYLNRTPSSAGNRNTWTLSWWMKRSKLSNNFQTIFGVCDATATYYTQLRFGSNDKLSYQEKGSANGVVFETEMVFRDTASWYHCVFVFNNTASSDSEKARLYVNGSEITTFSTDNRSLIGSTATAWNNNVQHNISHMRPYSGSFDFDGYLADVHFIDGQALAASDFGEYDDNNVWQPKAYSGTYGTNGFHLDFSDNSSSVALGYDAAGSNDWTVNNLSVGTSIGLPTGYSASGFTGNLSNIETDDTAYIDADSSHIDFDLGASYAVGTVTFKFKSYNDTTSANYRIELYSDSGFTNLLANSATSNASSTILTITHDFGSTSARYLRLSYQGGGRVARVYYLSTTGATGFNTFSTDSLIDTPTNYEAAVGNAGGNYATFNAVDKGSNITLSNGNLDVSKSSTTWANSAVRGTIGVSSGKWYWEITKTNAASYSMYGVAVSAASFSEDYGAPNNETWTYISDSGNKFGDSDGGSGASYGATFTNGDVIGIALDMDAGTLVFYKNGSSQGTAYSTLSGKTIFPWIDLYDGSDTASVNFGQRPFAYTPPTGHLSLCTQNLPDPTIADGSTAMDVALYTGTGSSQAITGLEFSPDFVWIKNRSSGGSSHALFDIVRGADKRLRSNGTDAELSPAIYGTLSSFDSNGFTVAPGSSDDIETCNLNDTYVGWAWDGGTSTVSNTDGSITSSVRANASAGFSIVSYTGTGANATIGHGLNAAPEFFFGRNRDDTSGSLDWFIYHKSIGNTGRLKFTGDATSTSSTFFQDTSPTSSVISIGTSNDLNKNEDDYIAYCFAPVEGYSAFGKWTGGSDAFVHLGFRPKFLLIKANTAGYDWLLFDSERSTSNLVDDWLSPNLSAAETQNNTVNNLDFLSNGFKIKGTGGYLGASVDMLYAAFASHPFKTARAR